MRSLKTTIIKSVILGSFLPHKAYAHQTPLIDSQLRLPMVIALLSLCIAVIAIVRLKLSEKRLQQSEQKIRDSIIASGEVVWDWNLKTNKLERTNDYFFHTDPISKEIPPNKNSIHPGDLDQVKQQLEQHLKGDSDYFEASYRIKDTDGKWRWVLDRGQVTSHDKNKTPLRMTGTVKDISRIKSTQDRLNLLATCIENLTDAVAIYDSNLSLIEVNKRYLATFGGQASEHIGTQFNLPGYKQSYLNKLHQLLNKTGNWKEELKIVHDDKAFFFELSIDAIRCEKQVITHYIAVYSDISERKHAELQLQKMSNRDRLTGLPNRNQFFSNLKKLAVSKSHHALLVFDLDNFKKINDSLGHQAGDILLCRLANRLGKLTRQQDSIYRLGGDEFALVIAGTNDIHTITQTAKEFLVNIEKPFHMSGHELVITSSVGIVLFPEDGNNPEVLLKNADTAMYHAKQHGNRYLFFNDAMNRQAVKRLQIENLIRFGMKEDQFRVFYQPKMDVSTGQLIGMEALVRFITPTKGLISPAQFIPVAEETGQIVEIGRLVFDKACADVKDWLSRGLFNGRCAVNLSAKQFSQPDLARIIDNILKKHELPANFLELEITEGTVMHDPKDAIRIMNELNHIGIHLSLDDFGTGYSSLAYLKQFPLDTLKIDRAFIDDMGNEKGQNMVDSVVTIAHNLGLSVVAEGVENQHQVDVLRALNCEILQGYFYAKPLAKEQFEEFLIAEQKKFNSQAKGTSLTLVANES